MEKCLLSLKGVEFKTKQIFSLTNQEFSETIKSIRKDFKAWVGDNFDLTKKQTNYLDNLDTCLVDYLSATLCLILIKKMRIAIKEPSHTVKKNNRVNIDIFFSAVASGGTDQIGSGKVIITVSY